MKISYSQVDMYQGCPQRYKLAYVDEHRKEIARTPGQIFGSILHVVLQHFHDPGNLFAPALDDSLAEFVRIWQLERMEEREYQAYLEEGLWILRRYYETNVYKVNRTAKVEERFRIPLDGHVLSGVIDRVDVLEDGVFEVIDYKTGRSMPEQWVVDQDRQLSIYHLVVGHLWHPKEIKLSLYYVHHNHKLSTRRTEEELTETRQLVLDTIAGIEAAKFDPQFGDHCDWCDYARWCPMMRYKFKDELEIPVAVEERDIEELAREYYGLLCDREELNRRLEELKPLIHKYFDRSGVECLWVDDFSLRRSKQAIYGYDFGEVEKVLGPLGLLGQVVKVENNKVAELMEVGVLTGEQRKELAGAKKILREQYRILAKRELRGLEEEGG